MILLPVRKNTDRPTDLSLNAAAMYVLDSEVCSNEIHLLGSNLYWDALCWDGIARRHHHFKGSRRQSAKGMASLQRQQNAI